MIYNKAPFTPGVVVLACILAAGCGRQSSTPDSFSGRWALDKESSSDVDQWRDVMYTIKASPDSFAVRRDFGSGRYRRFDELNLPTNGATVVVPMTNSSKWLDNVHLGVFFRDGNDVQMSAVWDTDYRGLKLHTRYTMETSTGQAAVSSEREFTLADNGTRLQLVETRSSRPEPLTFRLTKVEGTD